MITSKSFQMDIQTIHSLELGKTTQPIKRRFVIGVILEFQMLIKILTLELENLECLKSIGTKVG